MTDKVKFSIYVRENFKDVLTNLAKNKSKADNSYHAKYTSVNYSLDNFSSATLTAICHKISQLEYNCNFLTPIIIPKTNCLKDDALTLDNTRLVCVPSVQDRILQRLFIDYLKIHYKKVYNAFCEYDHALNKGIQEKEIDIMGEDGRPAKKTIHGIRKALDDVIEYRSQYKYVIKADIVKFFDNINRELAVEKFSKEFIGLSKDDELVAIFKSFIYCEASLEYGDLKNSNLIKVYLKVLEGKGVRQGMPVASLCSSMYLHEFDNLIIKNNVPYIRYADDFLIFSQSYHEAIKLKGLVQKYLNNIDLDIEKKTGKQKTKIYGDKAKFSYLGFEVRYSRKLDSYYRLIPKPVFNKALARINSYSSMTKVKREYKNYIVLSNHLEYLIQGYTNFYSEDLATNGKKFKRELIKASKDIRKQLISDNLNIDFEDIGSANKKMFFFGVK